MLKLLRNKLNSLSKAKQITIGILVLLVILYLAWSFFWPKPKPDTVAFTPLPPAIKEPKVPGPILTVPIRIIPTEAVKKKYPTAVIGENDRVVDTATIPKAEHGGTVISTLNVKSGEVKNQFKHNEAPWFELENKNYIGLGGEIGTDGQRVKAYYKRDIFAVKNVHLQVTPLEVKVPISGGQVEISTGATFEARW